MGLQLKETNEYMKLISMVIIMSLILGCSEESQENKNPKNAKSPAVSEKISKEKQGEMQIIDKYKHDAYKNRDENHPDAKVIQQLIAVGADLKKPHKPDFKFDFKDLEDARAVAKILLGQGFKSKIYAPQEGFPTYELVAEKEMIIEFNSMADLTDSFRKLSKEYNGTMSGWGTPIEK